MVLRKPKAEDLKAIYEIISEWNESPYVDELYQYIETEISHPLEYNLQFFVLEDADAVVGVGGIADPIPDMMHFATRKKPGTIKSLYVKNEQRGKGYGKMLLTGLEQKLKSDGYDEIILRSDEKFKSTAWDFYVKMGYEALGTMPSKDGTTEMAVFRKIITS